MVVVKILDWNRINSHKKEGRILGKFDFLNKSNIGNLFTRKVGVIPTFAIRFGTSKNNIILKTKSESFIAEFAI